MRTWILIAVWMLSSTAVWAEEAKPAEKPRAFERWYVVYLNGQRAGWVVERRTHTDDMIVSESQVKVTLARSGTTMDVSLETRFEETRDGVPLRMIDNSMFGAIPMATDMTFEDGVAHVISRGISGDQESELPLGKDWLPPAAADRFVMSQRAAGENTIQFKTMQADLGNEVAEVILTHEGAVKIDVFGRTVPADRYERTDIKKPNERVTVFYDADLRKLKMMMSFGGMVLDVIAADEQLAKLPLTKRRRSC